MAFFDNIGRKMSEAGQKVIQKTGEMSDTSRLNAQIADEEKKVNAAYLQIGKLYATVHRDDPEPELAGLVQSVAQSEQAIRLCREQIQKIKRVRTCSKCGAEVSADSAFCALCGNPMPVERAVPAGDVTVCASCGTVLEAGMRFCTNCGRPVVKSAPTPVPAPAPAPVAEEPVVAAPVVETPMPAEPLAHEEAESDFAAADAFSAPDMPVGFTAPVMDVPAEEPVQEEPVEAAPEATEQAFCPSCGAPAEPGDAFCMSCGSKL